MKTSSKVLAGVSGLLLMAASAQAESVSSTLTPGQTTPTTFSNHMHSPLLVSPAQLYQIPAGAADFSLGFGTETLEAGNAETTNDAVNVRGTGLYSLGTQGLKFGLDVQYADGSGELKVPNTATVETELNTLSVSPIALMDLGAFAFAYQPNFIQEISETKGLDNQETISYAVHNVGAVYKNETVEAGLAYRTEKDDVNSNTQEPNTISLHGRFALSPEFSVGGIVQNIGYSQLDTTGDNLTDQMRTVLTAEWAQMNAFRVEGGLGYNQAYYDGSSAMSQENIATWELLAGADYMLNPTASVGAAMNWENGSESNAGVDYKRNDLAFAVRGNVAF